MLREEIELHKMFNTRDDSKEYDKINFVSTWAINRKDSYEYNSNNHFKCKWLKSINLNTKTIKCIKTQD